MSTIGSGPSLPSPNPTGPGSISGPHSEPDDREEIYFDGYPPLRASIGALILCEVVEFVLIFSAIWLMVKGIGPWQLKLGMIVVGCLLQFIPIIHCRLVRYRISNYRIDRARGLISRTIDTLELWHVEDLHFHQSILNRILNVGTITVLSRDESMPRLEIRGLPNPLPIYETLKQRVIAVKRQRGVIKMDPG